MASQPYDPQFLEGIRWFNQEEFFEAHEVWEAIWGQCHSPSRSFYQGLIQAAVCLHHFGNGNTRGARKLFHRSCQYLEAFRPVHMGLDVDDLLAQMEICCREVANSQETVPDSRLNRKLLPKIRLDDETLPDGQLGTS